MNIKRNPIIAVVLNAICIGLGFVYVGKLKYAAGLLVAFFSIPIIGGHSKAIFSAPGLFVTATAMIGLYIASLAMAEKLAKRDNAPALKHYQTFPVYTAYFILVSIASTNLQTHRGWIFGYEAFRIPSGSMMPTVVPGDFVLVDTYSYKNAPPVRGDIVVFAHPDNPSELHIKRIIGIPGDSIAYDSKSLSVNGILVEKHELGIYSGVGRESVSPETISFTEQLGDKRYQIVEKSGSASQNFMETIPEDHYFLLGDNRDRSRDSRHWGLLPEQYIVGKLKILWMSVGPDVRGRLFRIGQTVE